MPSFAELLQQGAGQAWLFIPSAILLGALHGLEPGHSKTMMAAFIVAIRGTVGQAVMLGVAATISHTAIVWGIALAGMHLWQGVEAEAFEPWFQLLSGIIIIGMALWMLRQTQRDQQAARAAAGHGHDDRAHGRPADHGHAHAEARRIDTGHGGIALEIFEDGVPPRWRIGNERGAHWRAEDVALATERPDGTVQNFAFVQKQGYLESVDAIPKPHEFMARLSLGHVGHNHDYDLAFMEGHGHDHIHEELQGLALATDGCQDPHELAHANDIRRRFAGTRVSNWQIIVFGLTGGLIPCPAAITVLLLCLQLDEFALGATLVLCFSIGLAITLVAVGAVAAISVRTVSSRSRWFSTLAARAPYFSGALLIVVGLYVSWHGLSTLLA